MDNVLNKNEGWGVNYLRILMKQPGAAPAPGPRPPHPAGRLPNVSATALHQRQQEQTVGGVREPAVRGGQGDHREAVGGVHLTIHRGHHQGAGEVRIRHRRVRGLYYGEELGKKGIKR